MSSSADESSISSASLLVSPSLSSQGSGRRPPPTYGWDQVQDILDSSSSSSGNTNTQDDNDINNSRSNNNAALDREIALAMVDLTNEEKRKLSILMKDEYRRKDTEDSDEGDDYHGLLGFATPSLIHTTASKSADSTPRSKDHHSNNSSSYNSDRKRRAVMPTQYNKTSPVPVNQTNRQNNPSMAVYKSPLQSPISRASPRSLRSRQSPMDHKRLKSPRIRQHQQQQHQRKSSSRSSSPGFNSPLFGTGGFGSPLKIEHLIGSQWGQQSRRETDESQPSLDQQHSKQTQPKIKSRKKSKKKHPVGNDNQQLSSPKTPILSPPLDTSIISAFQSVQDTLDAELQDIDSKLQQSARREQRLEDEGEMMTPEPDGSFMTPQLLLSNTKTPLPSHDGKAVLETCEEYHMIDMEEVNEDVNLALALDFDLVAEEHDTGDTYESHSEHIVIPSNEDNYAAQNTSLATKGLLQDADNDVFVENIQIHSVRKNPPLMDAEEPKPNHLLPIPSSHPVHPMEEKNLPVQNPSPAPLPPETSIESSKPKDLIPIPSPHPVHPTLVAFHSSSFDNVTNNEEDFELKPNASLPMHSPQPMRPGLSNRTTALAIKIPRLPPQDREMNDTRMETHDLSRRKSIGRQSKVHPATSIIESISTNDLKSAPIKPRDSLKSSLKAIFKRSNSYGQSAADKDEGMFKRSYSHDGESKKSRIPKPHGMRSRSGSDTGYSRLESLSSFASFEGPRSTTSQRAKLHRQSSEAPSSPSASQRRKEYDAKLRAAKAANLQRKQTSDDKTMELQRHCTARLKKEIKSHTTSTDTDRRNESFETTEMLPQTPVPSPLLNTFKDSLNDVMELVTQSLDVSHMIYDDNLVAIATAEMDESAEFEAIEKLCSEMQTPPVHLKPEPSCSDAQSISVHSDEFFETIAEKADDILSLCVDGQLLAEDDQFYDAVAYDETTPVHRILYEDNYDQIAAFEIHESQAFAEAELHCSDGSLFEDALETLTLSPIPQYCATSSLLVNRESHEMISRNQHESATLIQQCYRKHQMQLAQLSNLNLSECSDLLHPELYDCLQKMQETLSLHSNGDRTHQSRLSQDDLQKQNYLEYYEHLMALFNSKIREMKLNDMQSGASNASKIQRCIRSLYIQKDYQQLQKSLQVLQSCGSEHQSHSTIAEEPSTPIDVSHEIKKYARSHLGMLSLQARFRGSRARLQLDLLRMSLQKVQSFSRMVICKKKFRRIIICITALQAILRGKCVRKSYFQARAIRFLLRRTRVVKMQAIVRGSLQRQSYRTVMIGMTLLQALLRGAATRVHLLTMKSKAIKLQAFVRRKISETRRHQAIAAVAVLHHFSRVQILERRSHSLYRAAVKIQCQYRASLQIHLYTTARTSLVTVQRNARGMLVRVHLSRCHSCAAVIQSAVRAYIQRLQFNKILSGIIALQIMIRSLHQKNVIRNNLDATVTLQSFLRSVRDKRRYRGTLVGITLLQASVRGRNSRLLRQLLVDQRSQSPHRAAVKIQSQYRASLQIHRHTTARTSLVTVQRNARGMLVRVHLSRCHSCAAVIQSAVRAYIQYVKFNKILSGITLYQAEVRGRQNRLLVCSKAAAAVAWNDLVITPENDSSQTMPPTRDTDIVCNANILAATLLQSLWRAFYAKIKVAKKLLLSWRMDCYYPSHIKNKMSFLRAGILVLKMANKGSDMSRQITSVIDSESYMDIQWRRSMIVDLSTAFGRKPGTFSNSQVTLVIKFRRRATTNFFRSQDYFIRAALLYALEREMNSLELKSMNLIRSFIQSTLTKARYRQCRHVLQCEETKLSELEVNAIKIQRLWRLYKYALSIAERDYVPGSPISSADNLNRLCQGCILIQALMRGYLLRALRDSLSMNACIIQRAWAKYISSRKLHAQPPTINYLPIIAVQRMWKEKRLEAGPESETCTSSDGSTQSSPPPSPPISPHKPDARIHRSSHCALTQFQAHFRTRRIHLNVVKIQTCTRRTNQLCRYGKLRNGIIQLQALVRGGWTRTSFYITYAATVKIQTFARDVLTRKSNRALASIDEVHYPLTKLQAMFRYYIKHSRFTTLKKGFVLLQAIARGKRTRILYASIISQSTTNVSSPSCLLCREDESNAQIARSRSPTDDVFAIKIQSIIRGALTKVKYTKWQSSVVMIQATVRGCFAIQSFTKMMSTMIAIQSWARGVLSRVKYAALRKNLLYFNVCAQKIQLTWCKHTQSVQPVDVLSQNSMLRKAIVVVQRNWRSSKEILRREEAAMKLQCLGRMWIARQLLQSVKDIAKRNNAAVKLQSSGRAVIVRSSIVSANQYVSKIQWCYKKYLQEVTPDSDDLRIEYDKELRLQYANQYASKIQQYYRHCRFIRKTLDDSRMVYANHPRLNYETPAVILLQARARGCNCRRQVMVRSVCAFKIQRLYKKWKSVTVEGKHYMANAELARKEEAAKKLQSLARSSAIKSCIKSANRYASSIQRCYKKFIQQVIKDSDDLRIVYAEELRLQYKVRSMKLQDLAAKRIQSLVRSWICQKDFVSEKELASAIDLVKTTEHLTPKILTMSEFISSQSKQSAPMLVVPSKEHVTLSSPVNRLEKEHYEKLSVRTIQKVIRGWLCRSHYLLLHLSAKKIQRCHRNRQVIKVNEVALCEMQMKTNLNFENSLIKIQAIGRKYVMRCNLFALNKNATIIQMFWRTKRDAETWEIYQKYCQGINAIQTRCKYLHNSRVHEDLASTLQRIWRGRQVRDDLRFHNRAASAVQRAWTDHHSIYNRYHLVQQEYVAFTEGMLRLQDKFHFYQKSCNRTSNLHQLASVLQATWRGVLTRRQQNHFNNAAVVIQGCWMAHYKLKVENQRHKEYQLLVTHIISFQRCFRTIRVKSNNAKVAVVAIKIQSQMRMYHIRTQYLTLVRSANVLQAVIRMHVAKLYVLQMLKEKKSVVCLQSFVRARTVRIKLRRQTCAAAIVQTRYRMSKDMRDYTLNKQAVVTLQGFARIVGAKNIYSARVQCCLDLFSSKAFIIQRAWSRFKLRHSSPNQKQAYLRFFNALVAFSASIRIRRNSRHEAAKKIQVLYFSWKMRLSLAKVLYSISRIQRASRHCLARIEKQKHNSASIIQRFFKNYCTDESDESDYSPSEHSTSDSSMEDESLSDQLSYSSYSQRGHDNIDESSEDSAEGLKSNDELHISSALIIQRFFKTIMLNLQSERNKLKLFDAIILLQYKWRRKTRASVRRQELAAKSIQSIYLHWQRQKALTVLTEKACQDAAAILFQKHVRSWRCRQGLLSYSYNAIKVQRCFRKFLGKLREDDLQRKLTNAKDLEMKINTAAVVIQSIVRCWVCKKKYHDDLHSKLAYENAVQLGLKTADSICSISNISMEDESQSVMNCRVYSSQLGSNVNIVETIESRDDFRTSSAMIIQRFFRTMMLDTPLKQMKNGGIMLQSVVRGASARRKLSCHHVASSSIQNAWRRSLLTCSLGCDLDIQLKLFNDAVILVQYKWRCKTRAAVRRRELAAKSIQSIYLQWQRQKALTVLTEKAYQHAAATLLQKNVRYWRCRKEYLSYSNSVIKVQRRLREYLDNQNIAAVVIQSIMRCWVSKKKLVALKRHQQARAAVTIQSFSRTKFGAALLSNSIYASTQNEKNNSITYPLQDEVGAARKTQMQYLQRDRNINLVAVEDEFATKIQMSCRRYLTALQHLKYRSATTIQSHVRMFFSRREFTSARESFVKIQSRFRRYNGQKILEKATTEAVVLQCWFRSRASKSSKLTLELKANAIKKAVSCATILQCVVRGFLIRYRLDVANNAARLIQRAQRASVIRLRQKLLQVFQCRSLSNTSDPSLKRSNSALLPKDTLQLNRVQEIAPNLPRQNGVFVEVILNSVVVVLQSYVRRYIAKRDYNSKIVAFKCQQRSLEVAEQETNIVAIPESMPQLKSNPSYSAITLKSQNQSIPTSAIHSESPPESIPYVASGQSDNSVDPVGVSQDGLDTNSHVILIQRIIRGSNVRNSTKLRASSQHQNQLNTSSILSSLYRFYTEEETRIFLEHIYQHAEEQVQTGTKSGCVSPYAKKLLMAEKQECID